ncbi:SIS domain-containing protein [Methanoculleus chikugoensis]|uniref:SIS domain-containing protein n=1 Tax=Methanoculleus chikugoensis TaxID=118126 RepID=UPI001FB4F50B|nr:SIS domain-containing protein [Methanoculleus chikugoensis]
MKEISYVHAEGGYAAGELKHGPFALLTPETPVVAVCTPGPTYGVMASNIKEMKARKAPVIALGGVAGGGYGTRRDRGHLHPPFRTRTIWCRY